MSDLANNPVYLAWVAAVHADGGGATKMPNGPYKGVPAEKWPAYDPTFVASDYSYTIAPPDVLDAWKNELSDEASIRQRAAIVDAIENGFATVAALPGNALAAATGIPKWIWGVGLGAAALFVVKSYLPRRNPRGRRRRTRSRARR